MKYTIIIISTAILFASCTVRPSILRKSYYWGNYSSTLYNFKKSPTDENREAYRECLLDIINNNDRSKKIPPGICCEYGYLLLNEGDKESAIKYFELELSLYPESKPFMDKLLQQAAGNKDN